jgi:hypothetical protein
MSETTSRGSSNVKYEPATVVMAPATASTGTSSESPRQRVVAASHTHEFVQLRFTPRAVRQSGADAKTS